MFVGHALLAFAAVGLGAHALGWPRERALVVGLLAGAFATVPDVDMAYALVGVAHAAGRAEGALALADGFWTASTAVHRGVTHSLVVAAPAAVGFAYWWRRRVAMLLLVGVVGVALVASGPLAAAVATLFCVVGAAVGRVGARTVGPRPTLVAALVGLLSHPFGDLFTGTPPAFLYPLPWTLLTHRVAPFADPTADLLLAFGVELAVLWVGVGALARLRGWRLRDHVSGRAALGAAYALAAFVVPPPTMSASYPFVFSVLSVGVLGAVPAVRLDGRPSVALGRSDVRRSVDRLRCAEWDAPHPRLATAATTGLAAVTLAGAGYAVAYALLF